MDDARVDLFVIGGGSGGVRAARIAAGHGARVAVAEEFRFGGTCVIRGCVPKKLLVYASRFPGAFADAEGFGFERARPDFDWARLRDRVAAEVSRLSDLYRRGLDSAGVQLHESRAVLDGPHAVRLADGRRIEAERVLVAVGGHPVLPEVPGVELGITSNEVFGLPEFPERMVIVGGGYVAIEFAGVFAGLGSRVTLVHRGAGLLRGFDADLAERLREAAVARGIDLRFGREVARVEEIEGGRRRVTLGDGACIDADVLLWATGRRPNVAALGLEAAGVTTHPRTGAILVDAASRTAVPSVYAVGDVTDRLQLTPIAIREGHAFADTTYGEAPWAAEHDGVPTAVFFTPELGTVGLTEEAAVRAHGDVDVYETSFRGMAAVLAGRDERTYMKLLVDPASNRVLGCHLFGEGVAEMAQLAAVALRMKAIKADFDGTVALHPSAAEELVTMRRPTRKGRRSPEAAPPPRADGYAQ